MKINILKGNLLTLSLAIPRALRTESAPGSASHSVLQSVPRHLHLPSPSWGGHILNAARGCCMTSSCLEPRGPLTLLGFKDFVYLIGVKRDLPVTYISLKVRKLKHLFTWCRPARFWFCELSLFSNELLFFSVFNQNMPTYLFKLLIYCLDC